MKTIEVDSRAASNLRKVDLLLKEIEKSGKRNVHYYALDLDRAELSRTLANLPSYQNICCQGLWGSYDDGFRWLKSMGNHMGPITILFLGSSIGNFLRPDCRSFLQNISRALRPDQGDDFIVAFDHCRDLSKIWKAYHDPNGM